MQTTTDATDKHGLVQNATGSSRVVLVCEHASAHIPLEYSGLGLSEADAISHAAWDPGALGVAQAMAQRLDALLVAGQISRLVYDCNRPPEAADAMPARSEVIEVPGNRGLTDAQKAERISKVYQPFTEALTGVLDRVADPILVTLHSFTPTYHGTTRVTQIGILHDTDTRLADAMLNVARLHTHLNVARNQPYGPHDGVTHTLQKHGLAQGRLNVMIEIRNDLISTPEKQACMAVTMAQWVADACATLGITEGVHCKA